MLLHRASVALFVMTLAAPLNGADLTPRQLEVLQTQVVAAYDAGDVIAVLPALVPMVERVDRGALDEALQRAGLPSAAELLLRARIDAAQRSVDVSLPQRGRQEYRLTLPVVFDRVQEAHRELVAHPLMARPLPNPQDYKSYDELLSSVAELEATLEETKSLTDYAAEMVTAFRGERAGDDRKLQEAMQVDYAAASRSLERLQRDVAERVLETRLNRLVYTVDLLENTRDVATRIRAAYVLQADGIPLSKQLAKIAQDGGFQRQTLRDDRLTERVTALVGRGRQFGGGEADIAVMLYERVIPAYESGDVAAILQWTPVLLGELDDAGMEAVDHLLKEREIPPMGRLLADARLDNHRPRATPDRPVRRVTNPKQHEVLLTLPILHDQLTEVLAQSDVNPAMAANLPIPTGFKQYHELLRELTTYRAKLQEAKYVAKFAAAQLPIVAKVDPRVLAEKQRRAAGENYQQLYQQAEALIERARDRELALRIQRLEFAVGVLNQSPDDAQRFLAAYVIDLDGNALDEHFEQHRKTPEFRQGKWLLNDRDLQKKTRETVRRGRQLAGNKLITNVQRLHTGLAWWVRGRYGIGPDFQGLLKSARVPATQQNLMLPAAIGEPTDPMSAIPQNPVADRRHHYTWAYQDQKLKVRAVDTAQQETNVSGTMYLNRRDYHIRTWCGDLRGTITTPLGFKGTSTTSYLQTTEIQGHLTPADKNLINRLVGYFEYQMALENLDALLNDITIEQLSAIEEIIQSRDELAVFTNLSRRMELPGQSKLSEVGEGQGDDFKRHGLEWVIALARIELGAMLAAFTDVDDPFLVVRPTDFEADAYRELLLDGLRSHYWALHRDPALREVVSDTYVEQRWLTYGRRLVLARAFHRAVTSMMGQDLNPAQVSELAAWKQTLDKLQVTVVGNVLDLLLGRTDVRSGSSTINISPGLNALLHSNKTRKYNKTTRRIGQAGRSN